MGDLQTAVVWSIVRHDVVVYARHLDAKAHFERARKGLFNLLDIYFGRTLVLQAHPVILHLFIQNSC